MLTSSGEQLGTNKVPFKKKILLIKNPNSKLKVIVEYICIFKFKINDVARDRPLGVECFNKWKNNA